MSNTKGWKYKRGEGLIQPEDMDCQGGSDENGSYERENKVKGK